MSLSGRHREPGPQDLLYDDVARSVCFLPGLDLRRNTVPGLWSAGYAGGGEQEYVWIRLERNFELLMASWRSHWGPELDPHFKNHAEAPACEPTPEHPWGPED